MTATKIMPRWSLTVAATAHAGLFAWVAVIVPWEDLTALGVLTSGLAGGYALTAVLAALRHRTLAVVWRAQSALSLGFFAYLLWRLASAAGRASGAERSESGGNGGRRFIF